MAALKEKTAKLGAPKIEGTEEVGGKEAPALYFGSTKMNNNFTVVDEIAKEGGRGMAVQTLRRLGLGLENGLGRFHEQRSRSPEARLAHVYVPSRATRLQ